MGVPAFFRWITAKYPKILVPAIEEASVDVDGESMGVDLTSPNPNGLEFDNLYLDMNGLIHPCAHPDSGPQPKTEEEMMLKIFDYIDEIFAVVRPRRLVMMAMDGVAPRAKMNQQRSRRFKAAEDSRLTRNAETAIREDLKSRGMELPPPRPATWDHNVITPGTEFMEKVTNAIQWYIHDRMNREPAWRQVKVILSDSNVPGEGEHKIMNFIRQMRLQPGYDPNTRHCLHGLDADLIMLALASHEPHFTISRDHVDFKNPNIKGRNKEEEPPGTSNFDFLHIHVLREYLEAEFDVLRAMSLPFEYDFERCLDDFVFLCFFVGNDFLPHLPSLEIREGALDDLIEHYTAHLDKIQGYLTCDGEINMNRVSYILHLLGQREEQALRERLHRDAIRKQKFAHREESKRREKDERIRSIYREMETKGAELRPPADLLADLMLFKKEDMNNVEGRQPDSVRFGEPGWKERYYQSKLGAGDAADIIAKASSASESYFEGLVWVFRYYFNGCPSWKWFYPFHYSPFASDLSASVDVDNKYEMTPGEPFKPFEQLMGVLPSDSKHALPRLYHALMESPDSPLISFFPKSFPVDTEGRRFAWQGVVILPWVDEAMLLATVKPLEEKLTPEETKRNSVGPELLFVHSSNPLAKELLQYLYPDPEEVKLAEALADEAGGVGQKRKRHDGDGPGKDETSPPSSKKMKPEKSLPVDFPFLLPRQWTIPESTCATTQAAGTVVASGLNAPLGGCYRVRYYAELEGAGGVKPIEGNQVLTAVYQMPPPRRHCTTLLPGVQRPTACLSDVDKIPAVRPPGWGHGFTPQLS
eukprot:RCo022367